MMINHMMKKSKGSKKASTTNDIPAAYICPLTKELMIDPLVNRYGITYERAAIIDHITNQMKPYCPQTKQPLSVRDLIPNIKLRLEIVQYRNEILGEDNTTTSNHMNYLDDEEEDTIRETECIRAMTFALSPPKRSKNKISLRRGVQEMKYMFTKLSPNVASPIKA